MYCANCGSEIDDRAVIYPHCGVATGKATNDASTSNNLAVIGFVLSFFISLAGLICSIMGYKKSAELNGKGKGLSLAGIIISVISMVAYVIYLVVLIATAILV
ncbi:MAG: DUF4190 domain-containing protein [Clostridia bacterium]|nr:DUF4190 domain-containing protein [Clostridia bacterium]